MIAFLIGVYGPFYGDSVAKQGYGDTVKDIRDAWQDCDMAVMTEEVTDELLDALAAAGTPNKVRESVRAFVEIDGIDTIRVGFASGTTKEEKQETMEVIASMN